MSFRDNLQHLRATRNMTQEQLAMLLGVSRQSVTKWEAEKSYPEMDKLLKLCQIFECSLDDLVQGDLTGREPAPGAAAVPAGPPTDVCGYDEHQRMMAWKVPTGVAAILVGIAIGLFFEGAADLAPVGARDGRFVVIILAGILGGLAFLVPAGMEHAAFQRAHPYVEDFYTDDDRAAARKSFSVGLVGGYGMLYGRTNVAEYNRSVGEELEVEEIVRAQLDDARREALLEAKRRDEKIGAVCAVIMILATIVGLGLLFAPVLASPDPSAFDPIGTSAMWFWVAWPVGALLCGVASVLMKAFGRRG